MSLVASLDDIIYYQDKDGDRCGKTLRELRRLFIDTKYWNILHSGMSQDYEELIERAFLEMDITFYEEGKAETIRDIQLSIF